MWSLHNVTVHIASNTTTDKSSDTSIRVLYILHPPLQQTKSVWYLYNHGIVHFAPNTTADKSWHVMPRFITLLYTLNPTLQQTRVVMLRSITLLYTLHPTLQQTRVVMPAWLQKSSIPAGLNSFSKCSDGDREIDNWFQCPLTHDGYIGAKHDRWVC